MEMFDKRGQQIKPGDHVLIPAIVTDCHEVMCEVDYWPRGVGSRLISSTEIYRANTGDSLPDLSTNQPDVQALRDATYRRLQNIKAETSKLEAQLERSFREP